MADDNDRKAGQMDPDHKLRRAECKMAVETARELIAEGIVPRSIRVGEVRIDVGTYQPRREPTEERPAPKFRGHMDRLADRIAAMQDRSPGGKPNGN